MDAGLARRRARCGDAAAAEGSAAVPSCLRPSRRDDESGVVAAEVADEAGSSSPAARKACLEGCDRRRLRLALFAVVVVVELLRLRCFMLEDEEEADAVPPEARRGREGSAGLLGGRAEAETGTGTEAELME